MKKKGVARALFLIIMIVIGVYAYSFYLGIISPKKTSTTEIMQINLYTMENAMKTAKLYAETSLGYSFYQACYDNLKQIENGNMPNEEQFIENLRKTTESNLDTYTTEKYNFLNVYEVNIPKYDVTITEYNENSITLEANSMNNIIIEHDDKKQIINLEKNPKITKIIDTKCFGIYQKGIEETVSPDLINNVMASALEKWPKHIEREAETCDEAFRLNTGKTITESADEIKNTINNDERFNIEEDNSYTITKEITSNVKITPIFKGSVTQNGKITVKCDVKYDAEINLDIKITYENQYFPVYNGKSIVFSPITLLLTNKQIYSA